MFRPVRTGTESKVISLMYQRKKSGAVSAFDELQIEIGIAAASPVKLGRHAMAAGPRIPVGGKPQRPAAFVLDWAAPPEQPSYTRPLIIAIFHVTTWGLHESLQK